MKFWNDFAQKHPRAAKWLREGGLFFLFSNLVTVWQYLLIQFLPAAFSRYANVEWMWPGIPMSLFGASFTFNVLGYSVKDGGLPPLPPSALTSRSSGTSPSAATALSRLRLQATLRAGWGSPWWSTPSTASGSVWPARWASPISCTISLPLS